MYIKKTCTFVTCISNLIYIKNKCYIVSTLVTHVNKYFNNVTIHSPPKKNMGLSKWKMKEIFQEFLKDNH